MKRCKRQEDGRRQARMLFPIVGDCDDCKKKPAVDRHHKNGDATDNRKSNIAFLCRRCHMKEDGRLEQFLSTSISKRGPQPWKACRICGNVVNMRWHGRCHACNMFLRRTGEERPYKTDGRREKSKPPAKCPRCMRMNNIVGRPVRGYCLSCYTFHRRLIKKSSKLKPKENTNNARKTREAKKGMVSMFEGEK